jgi:predicted SnoaL-like aldol condensation-catalyzing enzyme
MKSESERLERQVSEKRSEIGRMTQEPSGAATIEPNGVDFNTRQYSLVLNQQLINTQLQEQKIQEQKKYIADYYLAFDENQIFTDLVRQNKEEIDKLFSDNVFTENKSFEYRRYMSQLEKLIEKRCIASAEAQRNLNAIKLNERKYRLGVSIPCSPIIHDWENDDCIHSPNATMLQNGSPATYINCTNDGQVEEPTHTATSSNKQHNPSNPDDSVGNNGSLQSLQSRYFSAHPPQTQPTMHPRPVQPATSQRISGEYDENEHVLS